MTRSTARQHQGHDFNNDSRGAHCDKLVFLVLSAGDTATFTAESMGTFTFPFSNFLLFPVLNTRNFIEGPKSMSNFKMVQNR